MTRYLDVLYYLVHLNLFCRRTFCNKRGWEAFHQSLKDCVGNTYLLI